MLEEQQLDAKRHDRSGFRCGEPALDAYFHHYAAQQSTRGLSTVFVLVDDKAPNKVLGSYTLSAAQLEVAQLDAAQRKKLPRYPIPRFRMARLALSLEAQGSGTGALLPGLAVDRYLKAKTQVGAYALLVDVKNELARDFYLRHGFNACTDAPMTLYLPLEPSS